MRAEIGFGRDIAPRSRAPRMRDTGAPELLFRCTKCSDAPVAAAYHLGCHPPTRVYEQRHLPGSIGDTQFRDGSALLGRLSKSEKVTIGAVRAERRRLGVR